MKFLVKLLLSTVILSLTAVSFCFGFAAEYADTLRVGIYYGSGAESLLTVQSEVGFLAGMVSDRTFTKALEVSAKNITIDADLEANTSAYHVIYSSHGTPEEALAALTELKTSDPDAFMGFINSAYCVMGGKYKNLNDAQWAAENLTVKGTAYGTSEKAVRITDSSSSKILFVADDEKYGLGVYSADLENTDALLNISGSAKGSYRGGFEFKRLSGTSLTAVNIVPVEAYLYSVVCREMSPSWNVEALKAQAVCARNFALGRINYHKSYGFDVCRTVCCQAYSQEADQSENVHTAVDETRGELLFYEDQLVQAVYSSSMGAYTESVENVWGSKFPYLVSVENPYEDTENIYNGKWTKTLTKDRATEIMKTKGYDIGEVLDITVTERTPSGGVLKLTVKGTNGSKTFERESCRSIFSEATYSQRYTVAKGGLTVKPVVYIAGSESKPSAVTLGTVSVLTGDKKTVSLSDSCTATSGKEKKSYKTTATQGDKNTYTFSGEGWGHGVGMSQYGAKGMADAGFGYEDILTHYYTGTHIEKGY